MRIITVTVAIVALLAGACSKDEPAAPATTPAAGPANTEATAPAKAEVAAKAAEPAPSSAETPEAKPVAPKAAKPETDAKAAPLPAPVVASQLTNDEMRELERRPGATPALTQREVAAPVAREGLLGTPGALPAYGPDDALVKVFVFSDFQCPVCRRAAEPMKVLAREFPKDLQVIFVHNALTMHRRAEPAARAAIAAQRQGRFWEYYDVMFESSRRLEDADLEQYARQVGLDMEKFAADMADPAVAERVVYERALSEALQARGTPAFYVNGKKTVGWGSYFGVRAQAERAREQAQRLLDAGTPRAEVAAKATAATGEDGKRFAELVWGIKE